MSLGRMLAVSSTLAKDQREPGYVYEGIVVAGSWKPDTGTIKITEGASYSQIADSGSQFIPIEATLMYPSPGQCGPPRGGEQVCFTRSQGGWIAWYDNCFQSAIPTPAGEWWQLHFNANGAVDSVVKLTNDGPSPGDGLGGTLVGGTGALTRSTTSNPDLYHELDAVAQTATTQVAAGIKTIWDAEGNAISHIVPNGGGIGLGSLFSMMDPKLAAVNQDLINTSYSTLINNMVLGNLQAYIVSLKAALNAGGLPNPEAFASTMVGLIVSGWLTKVASFTGSATVRIAS